MKALRLPTADPRKLMDSSPRSMRGSSCSLLRAGSGARRPGPVPLPRAHRLPPHGGRWDLTGFWAIHPVPLPCSTTPAGRPAPHASSAGRSAPAFSTARAPAFMECRGSVARLQHLRPTLRDVRCRAPARLASGGSLAFTGRESNPLDRAEGFPASSTSVLPPFPAFSCR
jgi:hypothetical protein